MVLLYSERNAPKARQTNRRLANQLVATLPRMASHKRCDLDLYFKQRGLHKHLKRRLWNVLHYYVTPNSTDSEIRSILAEISDAHFYPAQLWAWIGTWEEPCAKIAKLVESRSIVQLGDHLRTAPQYVWGFIEHQKYFNIAHASVAADMLDVTMLLCRSTDPRARVGLNQSNFYDETPAHMAAGLLKTTHLRQLVNCEWVDLLVPDGLGRSPIHTLLSVLLRPSARIGKSMVEITAIVSDALSRCHMLAALRDHSGWTLADYALSLGGAGLLAVAVQPVLSVDSVFSSRTELNLFCVTLLKHAILKDDPGLVTYTQSLFQRFVVGGGGSAQGGDASIYALIDIVQFAVQSGRTKALHCICSDKETSLHLRQLGLLGWTPVPAALSPQGSTPGVLTALMRYFPGDNGWGNYHSSKPPIGAQSVDNMFSMAAFFGDVDAMRALLMAAGPAKIVLRRQAADDSPSYYFNRHVYRWSPIVAAVLGRSCDGEAAMRALLYVLQLTPFADLINAPQALSPGDGELGESCVTNALAEACRRMDLPVVRELCIHGADPLFSIPQPGPRQGQLSI